MDMREIGVGDVVSGQYAVIRFINRGAFGSVFEAEELGVTPARRCALKILRREFLVDADIRARFVNEARIASRIESPHVVTVYNASPGDDETPPWIALELLNGHDLAEEMTLKQRLSMSQVRRIFQHLADAVGRAHTPPEVILHRDLKPENIFLVEPWRADGQFVTKVVDYGISKLIADGATAAQLSLPMGSLPWLAPEQVIAGATIGPGTDVWALGLIAFYVLTGVYYWETVPDRKEAASVYSHYVRLHHTPLVTASERARRARVDAFLPKNFDAWFARCVVRELDQRWPDGGAACRTLVDLLTREISTGTADLRLTGFSDEFTAKALRERLEAAESARHASEIVRVGAELLQIAPADDDLRARVAAAWMNRARELEESGRPDDADRALDAVRALMPEGAGPAYVRGSILARRGRLVEALVELNRAVEQSPLALYLEERARVRFELGQFIEGITDIDAALQGAETSARLRTKSGLCMASGLWGLALENAKRAVQIEESTRSPELLASLRCRARVLGAMTHWEEAQADWDRVLLTPDVANAHRAQDLYERAQVRRFRRDVAGALEDLRAAAQQGHPPARVELQAWR